MIQRIGNRYKGLKFLTGSAVRSKIVKKKGRKAFDVAYRKHAEAFVRLTVKAFFVNWRESKKVGSLTLF